MIYNKSFRPTIEIYTNIYNSYVFRTRVVTSKGCLIDGNAFTNIVERSQADYILRRWTCNIHNTTNITMHIVVKLLNSRWWNYELRR